MLRFSEQVSLTGGSARVLDADATVVSDEARVVDELVLIGLPDGLGDGTYTVTFEVISADSHRITGASVFHVGAPSASGGAVIETGGDDVGWGIRFGASALSAIAYAGALLGVGGWWCTMYLAGRQGDRPPGGRWLTVITRAMILGAVALFAALPFRIARVGGGLDALRDDDFLMEALRGPIGVSTAVTVIGLVGMAALVSTGYGRRGLELAAVATGFIALAGFAIEGHTRSQRPLAVMVALDVVHVAAAAFWVGGIAFLVASFRSATEPARLGRVVARFSSAAVVSVVLVAGAGIGMSWIVLPSVDDLVSTGYGLALLTKVALVAVVVALGAYNRRRLVPAVSAGAAVATLDPRRRLARIVRIELAVLLAAVAVTAVLVARSPVSSSATSGAPPPVTPPLDAVELPLSGGAGTVSLAVAPARAGSNELRLQLVDPGGQPLDPVDTPTVELTELALELGPLRPTVHPLGVGDYHVIADIPIAGSWELTIRIRVSDFEAATATTVIDIAP